MTTNPISFKLIFFSSSFFGRDLTERKLKRIERVKEKYNLNSSTASDLYTYSEKELRAICNY